MQTIFISLVILLGLSLVGMAVFHLMFKTEKEKKYPVFSDITYDHIEEDIKNTLKRKKRKAANSKRKATNVKRNS